MIRRIARASFELFLLNPLLHTLLWAVLLVVALPLTIFGIFTTISSILIVLVRGVVVYWSLPFALISAWTSAPTVDTTRRVRPTPSTRFTTQATDMYAPSDVIKLTETVELGDDETEEEALSLDLNARLNVPINSSRQHDGKLSAELTPRERWVFDLEDLHRSPSPSRARTPYMAEEQVDYFPPQGSISPVVPRSHGSNFVTYHMRRKSGSGNSAQVAVKEVSM
ncbi:predicted protein [Plenodomus lingam JN3]|uniref:Uncharacterized protein n=2 Tax=Leptosphaeria maculans TaxID=5022 RepID=E5A6B3_LEPMJ|nr:predicted protein [Plenodomus lingam JN3]CBX99158.1 predicted protein [Plenodomus lingam JN3]